jgi:hypothetical protein
MRFRRLAVRAASVGVWGAGALAAATGFAAAAAPVRVSAAFDRDATLGSATAVDIRLHIDPRRTSAPLSEVRFAYPRSLGIVSSGLGLAACARPEADFGKVLITAPRLGGCSPNAVMALGTARALVRLSDGQEILEYASVTLLSGTIEGGRLNLVVYIDGERPFGAKLLFAGAVRGARAPYGGELAVRLPAVPGLEDLATVYLVNMRLSIGSPAIRYYERRGDRRVAYRPEGVLLPTTCPARGFRFRLRVGFVDGSSRSATSVTPCPPPAVATPTSGL